MKIKIKNKSKISKVVLILPEEGRALFLNEKNLTDFFIVNHDIINRGSLLHRDIKNIQKEIETSGFSTSDGSIVNSILKDLEVSVIKILTNQCVENLNCYQIAIKSDLDQDVERFPIFRNRLN